MKGADSDIGLEFKICLVTGQPADKSPFNRILRRISPEVADKMTREIEYTPDVHR